jgi:hypothetical protein
MNNLNARALLVSFSANSFYARAFNEQATREVAQHAQAQDASVGRYNQNIFGRKVPELNSINAAIATGRAAIARPSLPWLADGTRIMPAHLYLPFAAEMRRLETTYWELVEEFVAIYPQLVAEAPARLGGLYCAGMYPPRERLRGRFGWSVRTMPVPTSDDFRAELGDADLEQALRDRVDEDVARIVREGLAEVWRRLLVPVQRMADKLSDAEGIFRDTLVQNVRDIVALAPSLNMQDDADLAAMVAEITRKLAGQSPETLRSDPQARAQTAQDAKNIAARMRSLLGSQS